MIGKIRQYLANRLVKKVVKHVSKGNPYVMVALELYGVHKNLVDKGIVSAKKRKPGNPSK